MKFVCFSLNSLLVLLILYIWYFRIQFLIIYVFLKTHEVTAAFKIKFLIKILIKSFIKNIKKCLKSEFFILGESILDVVQPSPLSCHCIVTVSSSFPHAAAAKSLQSCPTLCNPIDSSPPGSSVPGILQARTLEWVAISFSDA